MKKRGLAWLLAGTMALTSLAGFPNTVPAEETGDASLVISQESIADSIPIAIDQEVSGMITENDGLFYYRIDIPSSGFLSLEAQAKMEYIKYVFYDQDANDLWHENPKWNATSQISSLQYDFVLNKGTYYFLVKKDGSHTGEYAFTFHFETADETYEEPEYGNDNTNDAAHLMEENETYRGLIAQNDYVDFYRFELPSSGTVHFLGTADMEYIYYKLYDETIEEIKHWNPHWNSTAKKSVVDEPMYLTSGTYYIGVSKDGYRYGTYELCYSFESANESFPQPQGGSDNGIDKANAIQLNKEYKGFIAWNDDTDCYAFRIGKDSHLTVKAEAYMEYIYYKIYDVNGTQMKSWNPKKNDVLGKSMLSEEIDLSTGDYFFTVSRDGYRYGNYNFSINDGSSEIEPVDPDPDDPEPANEEIAEIEAAKTAIATVKGAKKKLLVSFVPLAIDNVMYEVRFRQGKGSWKTKGTGDTIVTIKNLKKKKTYVVQVRPFKEISGTKYYGQWSDEKRAKTK